MIKKILTIAVYWSFVTAAHAQTGTKVKQDLENEVGVIESPIYEEVTEVPSQEEIENSAAEIKRLFPDRLNIQNRVGVQSVLDKYDHIDPTGIVPSDLLEDALIFFDSNSGFTNRKFITIVDYSKPSWQKRLFIIRMSDGLVYSRHVGHGRNSDPDHNGYLDYYSNQPGSYKSSKGFYRAAEIYWSTNENIGRALKLDGLSATNSNARSRGIVFHGSSYVVDQNVKQGRSLGCVTISWNQKDEILDILKGGSLLYVNNSVE